MKTGILFTIFLAGWALHTAAQKSASDSAIAGVWKGTSICQIRNSPCHDENVVYYITRLPGADTFNIAAYKIVNGKEEEMGIIGCKLDRKNSRLSSAAHSGLWTFGFDGGDMSGTLIYKGELYRIIKLKKQQS